jgi:hypothetical protein
MLLQKTLHMSRSLAECKARLASIHMMTRAIVTSSKTANFSFPGPLGFQAHTVLLSVESDSPDQCTFESAGGNINVIGIVDFAEIRPNCTEVTFAVHYEIRNKLFAWLDRRLRFLDRFATAELRSIRALEATRRVSACRMPWTAGPLPIKSMPLAAGTKARRQHERKFLYRQWRELHVFR